MLKNICDCLKYENLPGKTADEILMKEKHNSTC